MKSDKPYKSGKNHPIGTSRVVKELKSQSKKEESLKEVLGFFINKVDEKKFTRNKIRMLKEFNRSAYNTKSLKDIDDEIDEVSSIPLYSLGQLVHERYGVL